MYAYIYLVQLARNAMLLVNRNTQFMYTATRMLLVMSSSTLNTQEIHQLEVLTLILLESHQLKV